MQNKASLEAGDLADRIYYLLEPRGPFISRGARDETRYLVPAEVIEALSWLALQICVPFVVSVAGSMLANKLTKPPSLALGISAEELQQMKANIEHLLRQNATATDESDRLVLARVELRELLLLNGWPQRYADTDSVAIVSEVVRELRQRR